jgi:hypothetical protein
MHEKKFCRNVFEIGVTPDEKENFARFWFECLRLAVTCFPSLSFKMFQDVDFAVCPKGDVARVSNPG